MADFADELEEDEKEIYDIPPPPRRSKINRDQSDYENFKQLEVLPVPSLPPKTRKSIDLDEKFGIGTSPERVRVPASPSGLSSVESMKKYPVAAPRVKSLDSKQPVAMPRKRNQVDRALPVVMLPDSTTTESSDFDLELDPSCMNDDRRNNNLSGYSNSNAVELNNRNDSAFSTTMPPIYELDHSATRVEHSSNCSAEYINTDFLLTLQNRVQNGTTDEEEGQDYMNMCTDVGKNISSVSSASELKPVIFANALKQTNFSGLHSASGIADAVKPPIPHAIGPQDSLKFNDGQCMQLDSDSSDKGNDYSNYGDFESMNYVNVENSVSADTTGINLKELMVNCLKIDNISSPSTSASHAASLISKPNSVADSFDEFNNLLKYCDPLYELELNGNNSSPEFLGSRSSRGVETFSSSSPPKISPPPLPDGVLIDFSEDNFYKLPVIPLPVVPCRPLQSDESPSPPPVPTRKGSTETQMEGKLNKTNTVPVLHSVSEPVFVAAAPSSVAVSLPGKNSRKPSLTKAVAKSTDDGSRSVFYVSGHENVYEAEPVAYEMEQSSSCPVLRNGFMASDQNDVYEETDSLQKSSVNASHQGFLYLTGNIPKPEKKWCKLDVGSFNIYQNNQAAAPQEVVERVSMVSISNVKDDSRQGCCFELSARPPTVIYQFSADSSAEQATWITQIARNMALVNANDLRLISNINRGGNAFVRFGAESAWIHTWLHLVHKTLYIYNKDEKFDEIDLRKCKGLRSLQLADRCTKGFEVCSPLAIDLPSGRVIFIQSDLKKDQDGWFMALKNSIAMVDDSLTHQALTSDNVPVMVDKCINFVAAFGFDIQGIYRLNGQNSKVTKLQEEFRSDTRGMIIRSSEYTVHDVATALKRFFRQLDEPLLTYELYEGWIKASAVRAPNARLENYKSLLSSLPCVNYHTLKRVVFHLAMVADKKAMNKMDSTNLASIFGPILFKVDKDSSQTTGFGATNQEIKILKDLIDDHQWIFDIKDAELDQEKKIADAVKRIEQLNMARASQQTFTILEEGVLLGVYVNDKLGDVVTLKVSNAMTAEELRRFVAEKSRGVAGKNWTLFEVICNGELERPIHSSEKILEVTMKWSNWPQEFCQDNYLCFKFNKLEEPLQLVRDFQSSCLFSELHYCSKRSFHKYCFQYSQYSLGFRKDSRAENPTTSWLVEDIVIYTGIQRIRHPPTQWGFTFYSLNDKLTVPYFGHSICCSTEEEMYRWLSAMIYSQHQHGSLSSGERPFANSSPKPLSSSSSESNLNTASSVASKWRLPFGKRR